MERFLRAYPTIALFIEDLRGQGDAVGGLLLVGDILPHPHAVLLVAGDVQLSVVHLNSLQEADHILLLLLDLGGSNINDIRLRLLIQDNKCATFRLASFPGVIRGAGKLRWSILCYFLTNYSQNNSSINQKVLMDNENNC